MKEDVIIMNHGLYDINPVVCGHETCEPSHWYQSVLDYYLLHYILSGKGVFCTNGHTYSLREGNIFIIRPGESTRYEADRQDPWHYAWVGFSSQRDWTWLLNKDVLYAAELRHLFKSLISARDITGNREFFICAKVFEILCQIDKSEKISGLNKPATYVRQATNYIRSNYMNDISIAKIAEMLNLERSYFSSIFKKHTGISPLDYLIDYRLEKAMELITLHGYKVEAAAFACGYKDISNFSKLFRKKYNDSPAHYAQVIKSEEA